MTLIELPSLEQIEEMDKQRAKSIAALEIDNKQDTVVCQKCGEKQKITVPQGKSNLFAKKTGRIADLFKKINFQKSHYPNRNEYIIQQNELELQILLEAQKNTELLLRIPLYSNIGMPLNIVKTSGSLGNSPASRNSSFALFRSSIVATSEKRISRI